MLNSDSRKRSAVGRMACDFGAARARPRSRPPTILICVAAYPSPACGGGWFAKRTGWGHRVHRKKGERFRRAAGGQTCWPDVSRVSVCPLPPSPPHRHALLAGGGEQTRLAAGVRGILTPD